MIQRIQSIFLLIIVLCGVGLVVFLPFMKHIIVICIWALDLFSILIATITLFQYKNRIRQILFCNWLILINVLMLIPLIYGCIFGYDSGYVLIKDIIIWLSLPLISTISAFLARRYIKKDEELVRSADRIR